MINRTLRADAVLDILLGLLLLSATWDALYDALDLPQGFGLYTQLAGALLLAFAYLLWIAPRDARLTQAVAAAAAFANAFAAIVLLVWLVSGEADAILFWILVPVLAAFAAAEVWIASRAAAMLMPGD